MSVSDDDLSAYLDGALPPDQLKRIAEAIAADATLRQRAESFAGADRIIARAYGAIDGTPMPSRVTALLAEPSAAGESIRKRTMGGTVWIPLAASLSLAVGAGVGYTLASRSAPTSAMVAIAPGGALQAALDSTASGSAIRLGSGETATFVLSFRDDNRYCREFRLETATDGMRAVACRDEGAWKIALAAAEAPAAGGYAPAESGVSLAFDAAAEALGAGAAIAPDEEAALIRSGWRPPQ